MAKREARDIKTQGVMECQGVMLSLEIIKGEERDVKTQCVMECKDPYYVNKEKHEILKHNVW